MRPKLVLMLATVVVMGMLVNAFMIGTRRSGTLSPLQCVMRVDFANLTIHPDGPASCTLWELQDTRECFASLGRNGNFALLRGVSSMRLVEHEFRFGVLSTLAYARVHGYRAFVYVAHPSPPGTSRWRLIVEAKYRGLAELFERLDRERASEKAVFYADVDGYMNLKREPQFSLDALVDRANAHHMSMLLQGEAPVCSCAWIAWRGSSLARRLYHEVLARCSRRLETDGRPLCQEHPFDQIAFSRVLLESMAAARPELVNASECTERGQKCETHVFRRLPLTNTTWRDVAFVPQGGTDAAPQLHGCNKLWVGCDRGVALFMHTSHFWWRSRPGRRAAEKKLKQEVERDGTCVVAPGAVERLTASSQSYVPLRLEDEI